MRIALCLVLGAVYAAGVIRFAGIRAAGRPRCRWRPSISSARPNLQGNVLNHYGFGGYLISVGIKTFIDGRGELYGGDFIKRYVEIVELPGRASRSRRRSTNSTSTGRFSRRTMAANKLLDASCPTGSASTATTPPPSSSASASP